ncbi:regulator of Vps4 activity in the MVB pathway-domain-containing protein [Limtongia smithiae]|uniref:regulator of Vps4 activity in the MVB pathway-domain-containing protein n=1 Tax=Limtongia smithiae TaxID=1125753 RepID=UPI0034CED40E
MAPQNNPFSMRIKIQLKLSISRLRHIQVKETALAKQQRREVAQMLQNEKNESARIRVENIIRQEVNVELLEVLELYCELLLARIGLLDQRRDCDPSLEEPVKSIIYAAGRTDVKELLQVRDLLIAKFGKEFARDAIENAATVVAPRVYKKLTVEPPSVELVTLYLEEIARTYKIPWSGLSEEERLTMLGGDDDNEDVNGGGGGGGIGEQVSPLQLPSVGAQKVAPISIAPGSPTTDNPRPAVTFQGQNIRPAPAKKSGSSDLDDLMKRFEDLKR